MANYNGNKKKSVGRIIAGILCGVMSIAAVAGAGTALYMGAKNNGWFEKEEDTEVVDNSEESSVDNLVVNEGVSASKLSISSSRTASLTGSTITNGNGASAEYVEDSITLTANYNSDATSPSFTWTTSSTAVTLTPSSDTFSCVVTCNSAFSSQITITCTADDDTSVYATCTVDYIKRATNAALTITNFGGDNLTWTSNSSTATWTLPEWTSTTYGAATSTVSYNLKLGSFTPTLGTGTISETYTLNSLAYSVTVSGTSVTRSYDITSSYAYYYNILYAYYGTYPESTSKVKTLYTAINSSPTKTITMTFTGDTTGLEYTYTYNIKLDATNLYTSISSVSLNNSAIAF